jgi:prevent-host-death family protein
MTLRKNLGEILNGVEYKHDAVIITRGGKASAAIIDISLFQKIRRMKNKFEMLTSELQEAFSNIPEQEQEILINEALMEARKK